MRMLLVFTIPIVGAILFKNLKPMCLDGLSFGVKPFLAGADAAVALRHGGCSEEHHQGDATQFYQGSFHILFYYDDSDLSVKLAKLSVT